MFLVRQIRSWSYAPAAHRARRPDVVVMVVMVVMVAMVVMVVVVVVVMEVGAAPRCLRRAHPWSPPPGMAGGAATPTSWGSTRFLWRSC